MSFSKIEIINHNLNKIYEADPQFLNVMDFELLDLNVYSRPQGVVVDMEELDLIELDQNDSDYYLTEKGYNCVEAGGLTIKKVVKKPKYYFEEKPLAFSNHFHRSPERLKFILYFGFVAIVVSLIGKCISVEKLTPIPKEALESFQFQLDSLDQVFKNK